MKISYKDLFKNPANIILLLVFILSIITGFLFVYRSVHEKSENKDVNMKEISDNYLYYASTHQVNLNSEEVEDVVLILDDKNTFTLILSDKEKTGYVGLYTKDDSSINLFTNYYFSLDQKNEFKYFRLNITQDGSFVFDKALNNTVYNLKETSYSDLKSRGYKNLNVNNAFNSDDNKNSASNNFELKTADDVIKFIQNLNGDNIITNTTNNTNNSFNHLYGPNLINRYNLNNNIMLEFIIPNIDNDDFSTDNINNMAQSIFNHEINFNYLNSFDYNGFKYASNGSTFIKTVEVDNNSNSNFIKRVYNYEVIDNNLYIYEILINYECSDNSCRFYPHYEEGATEKNYFDFAANSSDLINILSNISKINSFKWTFNMTESGNYVFDSFQLI